MPIDGVYSTKDARTAQGILYKSQTLNNTNSSNDSNQFSSGNALTTWRGNLCGIDSSAANLLLPCLPLSHVWDASRVLSWSSFYRGSALWKRWSIFSHGEHVILNPSMQVVPDFAWCPHPTMQRSGLTSKRPHIAARGDILGLCKTRQTKIKNSVGFSMYWLCQWCKFQAYHALWNNGSSSIERATKRLVRTQSSSIQSTIY